MDAYRSGSVEEAISLQRRVVNTTDPRQRPEAEDFLLLGLFLHSSKLAADALSVLRDGLLLYPDSPELHENAGVCLLAVENLAEGIEELQRALALGSRSANVLDALCKASARLGRDAEAIGHGRKSLEFKDAKFGAAPPWP